MYLKVAFQFLTTYDFTIFFKHLALAKLHRGYKIADCRKASERPNNFAILFLLLFLFSYWTKILMANMISGEIWVLILKGYILHHLKVALAVNYFYYFFKPFELKNYINQQWISQHLWIWQPKHLGAKDTVNLRTVSTC